MSVSESFLQTGLYAIGFSPQLITIEKAEKIGEWFSVCHKSAANFVADFIIYVEKLQDKYLSGLELHVCIFYNRESENGWALLGRITIR